MKAFCAVRNEILSDVIEAVGDPWGYVRLHDFPARTLTWGMFIFSAPPAGIAALQIQPGVKTLAVMTESEEEVWLELEAEPTVTKRAEVNGWISAERPRGFSTRFASRFLLRPPAPQSQAGETNGVMIRAVVQHFIPGWDWGGDDVMDYPV